MTDKDEELINDIESRIAGWCFERAGKDSHARLVATEIIKAVRSHDNGGWISVLDELPLMELCEDERGGGHWYKSNQRTWVTDGEKVLETSFFQVWPDKGESLGIGIPFITHWKPYIIPSPPTGDK